MNHLRISQAKETELFFRQWLRSPKSMGAVIPSSRVLARAVTEAVRWRPGQTVIELGAGTGAISQGLIDSGLPPDALMIELDRPLFAYLRRRFPQCAWSTATPRGWSTSCASRGSPRSVP